MNVFVKNEASGKTAEYAKKELMSFLSRYGGVNIADKESEADRSFALQVDCGMAPHCWKYESDGETTVLTGGNESSLLCCVYDILSEMGMSFTTEGERLSGKVLDIAAVDGKSETTEPYCRNRGIRQHINFPMDISSYTLKDAKEYIRRLARMKFNAITFHSYNGQWHPYEENGERKLGGHFFYGQRHDLPDEEYIRDAINNRDTYCIPECENVIDDAEKRSEYAVYWLNEVMKTVKEVGMKLAMSVECIDSMGEERMFKMVREVLSLYPLIDTVELVTPEGGGEWEKLTHDDAVELARELFGEKALKDGELEFLDEPTGALGGTLKSLKQALILWENRAELLKDCPDKEMRISLYVTCKNTLKITKSIMNKIFPSNVKYAFLPAHGADAAAENIEFMDFTNDELQRTTLYSWIEFDGNMYVQQNSSGGTQKLLGYCESVSKGESVEGICLNHWRTAENSVTISYAAESLIKPVATAEFYKKYAENCGIKEKEKFSELMKKLEALDKYNRDNLFNVGFCYLGCWINNKGVHKMRGLKQEYLTASAEEYEKLAEGFGECMISAGEEGTKRLSFLKNRCACSVYHMLAMNELAKIADIADDNRPEALDEAGKNKVLKLCENADIYAEKYMKKHIEEMPDRGCEGTLISYRATLPVYIDHVREYFVYGEKECRHNPPTLDAPPSPDETYL